MPDPIYWDAIDKIREQLEGGCDEEVFLTLTCPVCSGDLEFKTHPKYPTFSLGCNEDPTHMHIQGNCEPRPEWWSKYVSNCWY